MKLSYVNKCVTYLHFQGKRMSDAKHTIFFTHYSVVLSNVEDVKYS